MFSVYVFVSDKDWRQMMEGILPPFEGVNMPKTNIYLEDEHVYAIELFLPGLSQEDIAIKRTKGIVIITSKNNKRSEASSNREYLSKQYDMISFAKAIDIPSYVDWDSRKASMKNGVLRISFYLKV